MNEAEKKIAALEAENRELKSILNARPRSPPPNQQMEVNDKDVGGVQNAHVICMQSEANFTTSRKAITRVILNGDGAPTAMTTSIYLGHRLLKTFQRYINRPRLELTFEQILPIARLYTKYRMVSGHEVAGITSKSNIISLDALLSIVPGGVCKSCRCQKIGRNVGEFLDHFDSIHLIAQFECHNFESCGYTSDTYRNMQKHISDNRDKRGCYVKGNVENRKSIIDQNIDKDSLLANIDDYNPIPDAILQNQQRLYEIVEIAEAQN